MKRYTYTLRIVFNETDDPSARGRVLAWYSLANAIKMLAAFVPGDPIIKVTERLREEYDDREPRPLKFERSE